VYDFDYGTVIRSCSDANYQNRIAEVSHVNGVENSAPNNQNRNAEVESVVLEHPV